MNIQFETIDALEEFVAALEENEIPCQWDKVTKRVWSLTLTEDQEEDARSICMAMDFGEGEDAE